MPGSSKLSPSLRFPHQNPVYASHLTHTHYMPRHLICLDFITQTILDEECRSLSSSLGSLLHSPVTSSLLGPNILLSTLPSNTLSLHSSLNMSDQVSHPYKTTSKIIILYTGCNRRNGPDFGRVFLMLYYTDITQNTYVQSRTVTEVIAREKCGLHRSRRTIRCP